MAADALVLKVREGSRVVNVDVLFATGVNADGQREILGVKVTSAEDGAGWPGRLPRPDRSRPTPGSTWSLPTPAPGFAAIATTLLGAAWQRCRTRNSANLRSATPSRGLGSKRCCTGPTTGPTPSGARSV